MAFYRLENNIVVEIFNQLPVLHSSLMASIIDTTEVGIEGDTWNGTTFDAPPSQLDGGDREPTAQELIDADAGVVTAYYDSLKTVAKNSVDAAAERARLRYITSGSGQALVYQEKGEQASAYVTAGYPADTTGYPFIEAEINATGKTKEAAADDILTQRTAWISLGATIEQERLSGKKSIDDATDKAGIDTALSTALSTIDAI